MPYLGKQLDSSAAALGMALAVAGLEVPADLDCLMGRPFAFRCPTGRPLEWLAPLLDPWSGVTAALEALGLSTGCCVLAWLAGQEEELLAEVHHQLRHGPVFVGPLDRARIWDRLEGRYSPAAAHFVLVLERCGDGFVVHDPEGCPFLPLTEERVRSALAGAPSPRGIVRVEPGARLAPLETVTTRALSAGRVLVRRARRDPEGGSDGLRRLAGDVRELRGQRRAVLSFALPSLGLARGHLAAFLAWAVPDEPRLPALLERFSLCCAQALTCVTAPDSGALPDSLFQLAELEETFSDLFLASDGMLQLGENP